MTAYLDIDDYKIGPPPNWRHFVSTEGKGKKAKNVFHVAAYIAAVEDFIVKTHKRHWEDICQFDDESAAHGELCDAIACLIAPKLKRWNGRKITKEKDCC